MEQLERLLLFEHECTHSDEINFKNQRMAFCFYLLYFEDLQISIIRNNLNARNFNNGKLVTDEKVLDIPKKYWDMFTCPDCGKTNLSFSANWKSVNGILICNDCTERITLSGQKKCS